MIITRDLYKRRGIRNYSNSSFYISHHFFYPIYQNLSISFKVCLAFTLEQYTMYLVPRINISFEAKFHVTLLISIDTN